MAKYFRCSFCKNEKKRAGLFSSLPIKFDDDHIMCYECYEKTVEKLKKIGTENRLVRIFNSNVFTDDLVKDNNFGSCVLSAIPFNEVQMIDMNPQTAKKILQQRFPIEDDSCEEVFQNGEEIFEIGNARFNMTKNKIMFYTDEQDDYISYIYDFSKIMHYEYAENKKSILKGGSGVGRAIVGGALFGGVGAIVGAMTAKPRQNEEKVCNMEILVAVKGNSEIEIHKITIMDALLYHSKDSDKYKEAFENVIKVLSLLDNITLPEEKAENFATKTKEDSNSQINDIVTSLKTLKSLLDEGIIEQEEFDEKKKQLLGI